MEVETRWLPPMSRGERSVWNTLCAYEVEVVREKTFDGLVGLGGGPLRYDFAVSVRDDVFILIEYDGEQHFSPSTWSGKFTQEEAERRFKVQKIHDRMKDRYAEDNGHYLLRIPYWKRRNISSIVIDFFVAKGVYYL